METNGDDNNNNKTGVSSKGSAINGNHTYGNDGKQNDVKKQVDSSKLFDDVVATTTTTVGKKKNKKRRKKRKKIRLDYVKKKPHQPQPRPPRDWGGRKTQHYRI